VFPSFLFVFLVLGHLSMWFVTDCTNDVALRFRSKFTLSWRALARALAIGPCGELGGLDAEVSEGHPTSHAMLIMCQRGNLMMKPLNLSMTMATKMT
jgi:hypothetical protein